MKIVQLHFCLLLLCGATESSTDKLVDLGQNVTVDCKIAVKGVFWLLIKPSQPPVHILRTFTSRPAEPYYYDPAFRERFSVQYNSSLFIRNITVNELGIYYCMYNDIPPKISIGNRILHNSESSSGHHNQTEENQQLRNETHNTEIRLWQTLLIISGLQICVLIIAVTGVIVSHFKQSPNNLLQYGVQNVFSAMLPEALQTGHRSSTFTVVEFTQLSPVLLDQPHARC